jgi:ADP-heptose:LPS heptosyltransferase
MQKLLIISKKSLGDIILQTGVIQALKEAHPRMQIAVACDARNASAIVKHPDVAEVLPLTLKGEQAAGFLSVLKTYAAKSLTQFSPLAVIHRHASGAFSHASKCASVCATSR